MNNSLLCSAVSWPVQETDSLLHTIDYCRDAFDIIRWLNKPTGCESHGIGMWDLLRPGSYSTQDFWASRAKRRGATFLQGDSDFFQNLFQRATAVNAQERNPLCPKTNLRIKEQGYQAS